MCSPRVGVLDLLDLLELVAEAGGEIGLSELWVTVAQLTTSQSPTRPPFPDHDLRVWEAATHRSSDGAWADAVASLQGSSDARAESK